MSHQDATRPKPCPLCGELPKVESFEVNPMFGGGIACEVKCVCGLHEGVEYHAKDDAIDGWNAYVDEMENDLDWRKLEDEARSELAREEGWE